MSSANRAPQKHARASKRRRLKAREHLARDRHQAQQAIKNLGLPNELLVPLWRHAASASAATRSRSQWTWVGDDSVFKKYGAQLGLVGTWRSGQEHRVLSGIDGVPLVVVIGDGKLVVPVDCAIRRPDPTGPEAPCCDTLHWLQVMVETVARLAGRVLSMSSRPFLLESTVVWDRRI